MIRSGDSNNSRREVERCLDPQLWHACAGGMVQMPSANSKVYYFPQGQAEHASGNVDFGNQRIPAFVLCRVVAVKFMADPENDEVFAKIRLIPLRNDEYGDSEENGGFSNSSISEIQEKPASFAKTLTQSDANNGGGFSVPRYCAETIFPRLDYSADPPVQTILAKDVHGEVWKFRHIYRGTPRRHLLTTGWSTFVNQKKLIAGDSIVFLRTENGDLCVGIRRATKAGCKGGDSPGVWNSGGGNCVSPFGPFSVFSREDDGKLMRCGSGQDSSSDGRGRGKVRPESVIEAASLAASGRGFEVVYYPRASTPEFCVKAVAVNSALRNQWCPGMRFKMAFETEDSSRISWFMGTISSVQVADPIRWPNSPWRLLQVTWDEPDLLQNVKRVSPWLVELVSNIPNIQLTPFSPPRKKFRLSQHPGFPFDGQFPATPVFPSNPLGPTNPFSSILDNTPAGIQGARHAAQFGISLSNLHLNKLQSSLLPAGFRQLESCGGIASQATVGAISTDLIIGNASTHDLSSSLTIQSSSPSNKKTPQLVLFGQPILTAQQISETFSGDSGSPVPTGNSSTDGNPDRTANFSDCRLPENLCDGFRWYRDHRNSDVGLETGHCKVFMESEDVGRTLDLSMVSSYEELYARLASMFGIEKCEALSHVLYRDATGMVKRTGEEPFSEFMKTARRLTILSDSGSDNMGR